MKLLDVCHVRLDLKTGSMCLYPKLVKNPKYRVNKKNGGDVPVCKDIRVLYVPVGCGNCLECRKQNAAQWRVRLLEDIKCNTNGKFITLTFSDESIAQLVNMPATRDWAGMSHLEGYDLDNEIATRAVRLFLERWRKRFGKSLRHWFSTEIGGHGSENIHLHGIVWTDDLESVKEKWSYGYVWTGEGKGYVNDSTICYITKYLNKIDVKHVGYKSKVLCSSGIGSVYVKRFDCQRNKFNGSNTDESYKSRNGKKSSLPIYFRNKIYSEEEREQLWLAKLDKQQRFVMGEKIDISKGEKVYEDALKYYRKINREFGYKDINDISEEEYQYQKQRRNIAILTRVAKGLDKLENKKNNKND